MTPISIDDIILGWAAANPVTLGLVYGILKVLAKRSKATWDDSILTLIGQALRIDRRKRPPSDSNA